ncbi:hypothetical protein BC834DRAFT_885225 [Gloeopeniophorella convolvens]|nr:hypothetical protein BC834DRAFT_885225 [Gloeopeniophorella convolvens]
MDTPCSGSFLKLPGTYRPCITMQEPQYEPSLLIDGYIAYTLGPRYTDRYLKIFKECLEEEGGSLLTSCQQGGWFTYHSHFPAQAPGSPAHPIYKLFDMQVNLTAGTVVPQHLASGFRKPQRVANPVFFMRGGVVGLWCLASGEQRHAMDNANALMPELLRRENRAHGMNIQIKWPGYHMIESKVAIYHEEDLNQPVSLSHFFASVVAAIQRFLQVRKVQNPMDPGQEQWRIGEDAIRLEDIRLIGLLQLSQFTWMPILQLTRHIYPICT